MIVQAPPRFPPPPVPRKAETIPKLTGAGCRIPTVAQLSHTRSRDSFHANGWIGSPKSPIPLQSPNDKGTRIPCPGDEPAKFVHACSERLKVCGHGHSVSIDFASPVLRARSRAESCPRRNPLPPFIFTDYYMAARRDKESKQGSNHSPCNFLVSDAIPNFGTECKRSALVLHGRPITATAATERATNRMENSPSPCRCRQNFQNRHCSQMPRLPLPQAQPGLSDERMRAG